MDAKNARPLLQKSSSDEDDTTSDADYLSQRATSSSGSSAVTRRLTNDADVVIRSPDEQRHRAALLEGGRYNGDGDEDDDDDEDHEHPENLAKELLRTENAPRDRFGFTYVVFYLLGMTTLLPWNFFITADDVSASKIIPFHYYHVSLCVSMTSYLK